jgi:peptide/nickel transport system substrate-binding protein
MKKYRQSQKLLLVFLIAAVALIAAQCGAAAPEEPAPAVQEEAIAEPEETEEAQAQEGTQAEPTEEAVPTPVGDIAAEEVDYGIFVETDEPDVSTPRDPSLFGGQYRVVQISDIKTLHPYLPSDASSSDMASTLFIGSLINFDEDTLEIEPYLAESYEISEDGLTFTFHLRKDLKWSDGEPFTAYDYEWTYNQVMAPDSGFPHRSQYDFVSSYEAIDEHTLQIKIDEIYAPGFLYSAGMIDPLPKHIWENLDWDDPETNPEINHPSVVSGAYLLKEWERDQYIILEANPNYWYHGRPNINEYIYETIPDANAAFLKFENGEVDSTSMTPDQLEEARTFDHVTVHEWWPINTIWSFVGLNMREGYPTNDINIRHGLSYGVDKETLIEVTWGDNAERNCTVYPRTSWAHNPDVECYRYNPEKALEAFAKSGYTLVDEAGEAFDLALIDDPTAERTLVNEAGEQLSLRMVYNNTSPTSENMVQIIQSDLKKLGVEIVLNGMEWNALLDATSEAEPEWEMYLSGWRSGFEPSSGEVAWIEENIPRLNSIAYINEDVERLFQEATATYDREERKAKYGEIQDIIVSEAPYIFLYHRKQFSVKNNRIQGVEPKPVGIGWNQEDWFIAE